MSAATVLATSASWRVGRWRCRLEVEQQGADFVALTRWEPDWPDQLDSAEVDQLRAGRAIAKSQIEAALGRPVVLK